MLSPEWGYGTSVQRSRGCNTAAGSRFRLPKDQQNASSNGNMERPDGKWGTGNKWFALGPLGWRIRSGGECVKAL
eukprot:g15525.t1